MEYVHTQVFRVRGVLVPPDEGDKELVVDPARGLKAVLTNNPDELTKEADRSLVVANMFNTFLAAIFGGPRDGLPTIENLPAKVQEFQDARRRESGGSPYLVVILKDRVPDFESAHQVETDDFGTCVDDGPSKSEIRDAAGPLTTAVIAAASLSLNSFVGIKKLSDAVVFFREDGKPLYTYTSSLNWIFFDSSQSSPAEVSAVAGWYPKLVGDNSMARVIHLLASSYESESDKLRSFLGAWTALEIFVNKVFITYETKFFHELKTGDNPAVHGQYLDRIRDVMKDKYRIFDKFAVLACQLSPEDADADVERFKEAKNLRDKISHGQDVIEATLPVESVQALLRKYLRFHLA